MKIRMLGCCLSLLCCFAAQPAYSVIGYINLKIYPGDNLVANQLNAPDNTTPNNTLNNLFHSGFGGIPDGITFTKWNSGANSFLPISSYSALSDAWSINYTLNLGEGGLLNSPSPWTNTFVGELLIYTNVVGTDFGPGLLWNPNYADGLHLISAPDPVAGPISLIFPMVTGRLPEEGEWVRILDAATQTYITSTFSSLNPGTGWDNGDPTLGVGEAAWFNLGPVNVPEPSTLALAGLCAAVTLVCRRGKRSLSISD